MRLIGLMVLIVAPVFAGEYAVLATGARLHVDRHEVDGVTVRLYNGDGYTQLPQTLISGYEPDGRIAPPAVPVAAPAATAPPPTPSPEELADQAADKYGLPRALVRSVIAAESGFQVAAVSPKGAIGLMQLMPGTAQTLNADPHDPAQNADAGTRYLRDLLLKYDGRLSLALAAYNAGPGTVDKYNGIPPYRETINYVKRIDAKFKKARAAEAAAPADGTTNSADGTH
jgi:soluble lytic murein transglycosylase-like protein